VRLTGKEILASGPRFPHITRAELGGNVAENPRIYDLVKHVPKETEGKSPSIWAWPQVMDLWKVAGQPVPGPWPPHQEARPDPEAESIPVAIPESRARRVSLPNRPVIS
jgi:hypothetical protein